MDSRFCASLEEVLHFRLSVGLAFNLSLLRNRDSETPFEVSLRRLIFQLALLLDFPQLYTTSIRSQQAVSCWLSKPEYLSYCVGDLLA